LRGGEYIGRGDLFKQALEFRVGEFDAVERLKLFAEVALQRGAVADVGAVFVFQALQLADEAILDLFLFDSVTRRNGYLVVD
jgi:hypothetical protein